LNSIPVWSKTPGYGASAIQKLTLPADCTVRPVLALVTDPKSAAPKVAPGILKMA
jgi:hypothetical protein